MADYANDEEQLDALKSWWADNGQTVIIGTVVGLSLVIGTNLYRSSRTETLQTASALFQQQYGELTSDSGSADAAAVSLVDEYANTPYATLASLADAKKLVAEGDLDGAAEKLNWAIDNADQPAIQAQAQLRLAAVLIGQHKYDEALEIANGIEVESYSASTEEIKGDIATARGDLDTARNAYQGALTQVDKALPQHRAIIQLKLDGLGSLCWPNFFSRSSAAC